MRSTRVKVGLVAGVAAALSACSLLTHLDDPTEAECTDVLGCFDATTSGEDASLTGDVLQLGEVQPGVDARSSSSSGGGGGEDAPSGVDAHPGGGEDAAPPPNACVGKDAGALCFASGCQCTYCQNGTCSNTATCPDGFNWQAGNDLARCCSGSAVTTTTNANCGVCGVRCATAGVTSAQDCQLLDGRYQCVDCAANSECWSGCCAIDTTPYHCAASDCNTGACVTGLCPAPSVCVAEAGLPNYCAYE